MSQGDASEAGAVAGGVVHIVEQNPGLARKVQEIDESRPARPYPVERATRDATTWRAVDIAGELSGEPLGAR